MNNTEIKTEAILRKLLQQNNNPLWQDFITGIPRILCGLLLTIDFGSSKFGMPWTDSDRNLSLFEVAPWFTEDVAKFDFPFSLSPWLFAWLGAATEAIGGVFLTIGFGTRFWSVMLALTMLTAIFFQKWSQVMEQGVWPILPALGFLWVALFGIANGSGKLGLDYYVQRQP